MRIWLHGLQDQSSPQTAPLHRLMGTSTFAALRHRSRFLSVAAASLVLLFTCALLYTHFKADDRPLVSPIDGPSPTNEQQSKYYEWDTPSAFNPVKVDYSSNASAADICASFPTHLLADIQPVLKTGHGVLNSRVRPQVESGLSCLDNLLLFSDTTEQYHRLHLVDVIAEIPQQLIDSTEQLEPYRRLRDCAANGTTSCDHILTGKDGWNIDKFKFLASVSRAWKMRPEKRWYVFFEADTYIVWDTVFRLLSNFDADVPLYFGSPSPGRMAISGSTTWFANGGSGFVLSREAMRRLVKDDWDSKTGEWLGSMLTDREWEGMLKDCCGDSILGWALHEREVDLSGLWPMFNPHPPHSVPFSDLYWCQPIIGMHKPHEEDIEGLWRWEGHQRSYGRPLLYRDLAVSYFNVSHLARKTGWDNAAWDAFRAPISPMHQHKSADNCESACEAHESCFQWTHHANICTFVRSIRIGEAARQTDDGSADLSFVAGWATDRINAWIESNPCGTVQWVKPSIKRVF